MKENYLLHIYSLYAMKGGASRQHSRLEPNIVGIMGNVVSILRNTTTNETPSLHKADCVVLIYKMLHKQSLYFLCVCVLESISVCLTTYNPPYEMRRISTHIFISLCHHPLNSI